MPLQKIQIRPGVNRENTRYTTEGGWYESDKVRFRFGTPEKIGGWEQYSPSTFLGVGRTLWPWNQQIGLGTNLKYYISYGGNFNDVTPIRSTTAAGDVTFAASAGSSIVTATDTAHGCVTGDFVTFSGAVSLGGNITSTVLNAEYQVTVTGLNTYTVDVGVAANASDIGNGGAAVVAAYQLNVGEAIQSPLSGWGSGGWGSGPWGSGVLTTQPLRIWNAGNFGEDLVFGPKGGGLYYWDATSGFTVRGVALTSLPGASDVPTVHNNLIISDASRFVLAFGVDDYGGGTQNKMLIRWSSQENAVNWTPAATNQAGSLTLSHGSEIVAVAQVRQEILVWTDLALYSLQYLGPPIVWGSQLLADNVSIISDRAQAVASGAVYWMGEGKFYVYDGRVNTLPCAVRQYVFGDFNYTQNQQIFASTVERFNEVWWFYCSSNSTTPDRYVVYNYLEQVWYYGMLERTAWTDAGIVSDYPIAVYGNKLMAQEVGSDDNSTGVPIPISAYITSSEFDIDDGDRFSFIWRVLPDITFRGSTAPNPKAYLTLLPMQNSGSGYNSPASLGGSNTGTIARSSTVPIEQFTGQVNVRVRGRQMAMKIFSDELGVQWQSGFMRLDIRPDGRKS